MQVEFLKEDIVFLAFLAAISHLVSPCKCLLDYRFITVFIVCLGAGENVRKVSIVVDLDKFLLTARSLVELLGNGREKS